MNPTAIANLQRSLGLPASGVLDTATYNAMNNAVHRSLSANPDVKAFSGGSSPESIANAYVTGDWSGVSDLSGKPFTDEQQKAAVTAAEAALAPGFKATEAYDTSKVQTDLQQNQEDLASFRKNDAEQFGRDKLSLDEDAANKGILYSGSRLQKLSQLGTDYGNRDAAASQKAGRAAESTARDFAYNYGSDAAGKLSSFYSLPGQTGFDARTAGGKVTPSSSISAVYNPGEYAYQGTKPVANKAAVQTRAAGLLANRANKLSLTGYGTKL